MIMPGRRDMTAIQTIEIGQIAFFHCRDMPGHAGTLPGHAGTLPGHEQILL